MTIHYTDDAVTLWHGDCRLVLAELPDESVDAVVTDPPYELSFMSKHWDGTGIAYNVDLWRDVLRVLKPGGHLLAFGGTRTWHRLACAIEDAGFEVRDSIAWMYGSGFPKSLDVSKAMDKANGEPDRLRRFTAWMRTTGLTARILDDVTGTNMGGHYLTAASQPAIPTSALWALIRPLCGDVPAWVDELVERVEAEREVVGTKKAVPGVAFTTTGPTELDITAPATPLAKKWQGWGTALKPAFEPIVVARKPLVGTVAANVERYGTGALNIDACRIGMTEADREVVNQRSGAGFGSIHLTHAGRPDGEKFTSNPAGRWPANVILDESQAAELDRQSGSFSGQVGMRQTSNNLTFGVGHERDKQTFDHGTADFGGASRFFYTAKADSSERPRVDGVAHPTVKPLDLMRYLVRLVTPPGGVVLEPFAGSGTTLEACIVEGFRCIGIEREADYIPLIMARITKPIEVTLL